MKTFFDLIQEVQKPGLCHRCGGCVTFCSAVNYGALDLDPDGKPRYGEIEKCIECGLCYAICPEIDELEAETRERLGWEPPIGRVIETTVARAGDPAVRKNATDGGVQVAVDAIHAARRPHHFLSLTKAGHSAIFSTTGNEDCHVILRGGKAPNYDPESVAAAAKALESAGLPADIMIDFSHANSMKDFRRQLVVGRAVADQIAAGDRRIFGVMIESHLKAGSQKLETGKASEYGISITDACIAWEDSEALLEELAHASAERRRNLRGKVAGA